MGKLIDSLKPKKPHLWERHKSTLGEDGLYFKVPVGRKKSFWLNLLDVVRSTDERPDFPHWRWIAVTGLSSLLCGTRSPVECVTYIAVQMDFIYSKHSMKTVQDDIETDPFIILEQLYPELADVIEQAMTEYYIAKL